MGPKNSIPEPTHVRSAQEVFDDHLRESIGGTVEADLHRNYDENVILLTGRGIYKGSNGLLELAALLRRELPKAHFEYRTRLVHGEMAFLEWAATSEAAIVRDGADSYLIRNGRIMIQTIHYTVEPREKAAMVHASGTLLESEQA